MKKIFLFLIFSLFIPISTHADIGDPSGDSAILIFGSNCTKSKASGGLGGRCDPRGDAFQQDSDCEDSEEWAGFCRGGQFFGNYREDCCIPKDSATQADLDRNATGQWVPPSQCTRSKEEGGIGGKCETADSGFNPFDFDDSCSEYTNTPHFAGLCGRPAAESAVCCVSQERFEELGGATRATDINYGTYQLLEQIPGSRNTSGALQPYFESIYKVGFVLIIIGAVFMIGLGGFIYMSSAGNTYLIKKGKGLITDALIGLIVALFVWLILNIINPDLVRLQIDPLPGISFDPNSTGATTAANNSAGESQQGNTLPCEGGLISIPSELGRRLTSSSQNQICKDIADKLLEVERVTGIQIFVTSSVRTGPALSSCHRAGNADTGNCADIGLSTSLPLNDSRWGPLCQAVSRVSGLQLVNEAANIPECTSVAPFRQYETSNGAHFHIKLIGR